MCSTNDSINAHTQVDCAHSKRHSWRSSSQYLQQRRLQQQSDTVQNVPINGNKRTFDSITMSVDGTSDGTDSSQGTSETTTAKQSNSSAGKSTTSSSSGSNSVDDDAEWNEWLADKDWWLAVGGQRKRRRFEPDSAEKKPVVKTQQRRHKRDDTLERVFERICASAAQKVTQVNTPV